MRLLDDEKLDLRKASVFCWSCASATPFHLHLFTSSPSSARQLSHQREQFIEIHRLDQIALEPGFPRAPRIL